MARRRKVDASKLIEAVKDGRLDKDVMDRYGVEARPKKDASGRRRRARRGSGPVNFFPFLDVELKINKRGSLVLSRSLMEELGFEEGDDFIARKTKIGISLRKID